MNKLPEMITECPEYAWNPELQMYDAVIFRTRPDGTKVIVKPYVIQPRIFGRIITSVLDAQQQFFRWRERPDNVVRLRGD